MNWPKRVKSCVRLYRKNWMHWVSGWRNTRRLRVCVPLNLTNSILLISESKKGDTSPETALALLQTKVAECEEASEKLVSKLTGKESTIEEFLDAFLDNHKEVHLRKLKVDKMVELIQQQKTAARGGGSGGNRPAPYPSNFYGTPGGGPTPYPTGPYHMPMPGVPGLPGITGNMYRQPF